MGCCAALFLRGWLYHCSCLGRFFALTPRTYLMQGMLTAYLNVVKTADARKARTHILGFIIHVSTNENDRATTPEPSERARSQL